MKIQDIIIWVLFILSILVALWYLFGNSPTFEQAILVLILTILIANVSNISEIKTRLKLLEGSFIRLVADFKEMRNKSINTKR